MRKQRRKKKRLRKTNHTEEEFYLLCSEFDFHCVICGDQFDLSEMTRDHVLPVSKGGQDYIWNIQPVCAECNSFKDSRYGDFRPFIPSWISEKLERYNKNNRK